MKVYTIDIYYGEKLIDTIEIEASSEYDAILIGKSILCNRKRVEVRNEK